VGTAAFVDRRHRRVQGLADAYTNRYETCPVQRAAAVRVSRLALCDLTGGALGLALFGIEALAGAVGHDVRRIVSNAPGL
jgi:hypothetical protein